jgi:hypothetical protein
MEKTLLKSTIIMNLQEKVEQGNHASLQEFWGMVETKGTPLIEKIDGALENSLITFIYKVDSLFLLCFFLKFEYHRFKFSLNNPLLSYYFLLHKISLYVPF